MSENKPKNTLKANRTLPKSKEVIVKHVKSTKAELNQRVTEVSSLLLEGHTRHYIIQYGAKWKLSDRQIDDYISMAWHQIKEINALTLQDNLASITSALWATFRKAKQAHNISEMRQCLAQIAKIRGLDQQVINHVIEDKRELEELTDSELDAILEAGQNTNGSK